MSKEHNSSECNHLFSCDKNWTCECENDYGCEECNDQWESEESVAEGLGFYIDDDGQWMPID